MYGLIVKLTVVPARREEMIGILKESAADMPGCFSYVVAKDPRTKMPSGSLRCGTALPVTTPLYRCLL